MRDFGPLRGNNAYPQPPVGPDICSLKGHMEMQIPLIRLGLRHRVASTTGNSARIPKLSSKSCTKLGRSMLIILYLDIMSVGCNTGDVVLILECFAILTGCLFHYRTR